MTDPKSIFIILVSALLAGIAIGLIFVSCAALAQERPGERHGGGWGGGGGRHWQGDNRRPAPRYAPQSTWSSGGLGRDIGVGVGTSAAGSVIGNWIWHKWASPQPQPPPVVVVQQPAQQSFRTVGWCLDRYRSYDVASRTYLGYDGYRHSCP
jgi:BA14K-like protein